MHIDFEETVQHKEHTAIWKSWVVLAPEEGWAVREFQRASGRGSQRVVHRTKLWYSGVANGVPLVQAIETETLKGEPPKCTERAAVEISQIKLGDPSDYYFTSFAF